MLLFNIFFFAFVFAGLYFNKKLDILSCIYGFVVSSAVCFIRGLSITPLPIEGLAFYKAFFRFFVPMIIIPVAIIISYVIFNKDDLKSKAEKFFHIFIAIFAVAVPFETMRNFSALSFYAIFLRPVIYFAFINGADFFMKKLVIFSSNNGKKAAGIFAIILEAAIPCIFDAAYFFDMPLAFILSAECFYCIFNIFYPFFQNQKEQNSTVSVPDQESSDN